MSTTFKYYPEFRVIFKRNDQGRYESFDDVSAVQTEVLDNLIFRSKCKGEWMGCQLIKVVDGSEVTYRHYHSSLDTELGYPFVNVIYPDGKRTFSVGEVFNYYDEIRNV